MFTRNKNTAKKKFIKKILTKKNPLEKKFKKNSQKRKSPRKNFFRIKYLPEKKLSQIKFIKKYTMKFLNKKFS